MYKKILIDNGHGSDTIGKQSPDGRLQEWLYARQIARAVHDTLKDEGYDCQLLVTEDRDISLFERVRRVNDICDRYGAANVLLVSIHVDAIGTDGRWHDCGGWSCYTTKGETESDKVAECMYDAAEDHLKDYAKKFSALRNAGVYGKKQKAIRTDTVVGDRDKEANYTILYNTRCAAVLTENLFQDNICDVCFLLSDEGRETITAIHVDGIKNYVNG